MFMFKQKPYKPLASMLNMHAYPQHIQDINIKAKKQKKTKTG